MARARRRLLPLLALSTAALTGAVAPATTGSPAVPPMAPTTEPAPPADRPIHWRRCRTLGKPWAGRLINGTRLPSQGRDFFTWDPAKRRKPNRRWRRYACDFAIRKVLRVLRALRKVYPDAPRIGIGDLSRPRGGRFGRRYGGLGHASHQSGVDIDIYYPRWDALESPPRTVDDIDFELSQALADALVRARAKYVFVGPNTGLRGRRKVVQRLVHHDDHLHVRLRVPRSRR